MPESLAEANVIPRKDARAATFKTLIQGSAVQFSMFWGEVFVTTNRVQVAATEAPYVRVSDFVLKALNELSGNHIVRAFGINMESHFDLGSSSSRDSLGMRIAPTGPWGSWGRTIQSSMSEGPSTHGGMMRLQMRQKFEDKSVAGWLDVTISPSTRIPNESGVEFRSNHHHQPASADDEESAVKTPTKFENPLALLEVMAGRFDESIAMSERIFLDVLGMEP